MKEWRISIELNIEDSSLFNNISLGEINRIMECSNAKIYEYEKDELIVDIDDKPEFLFLILEGTILMEKSDYTGKYLVYEYKKEGDIFGQEAIFSQNMKYDYYVKSVTSVKVLGIKKEYFFRQCPKSCSHHSSFIYNTMHLMARENIENKQRIRLLTCGELSQRVANYLLNLSDNNNMVYDTMTRDEQAIYLNTTRPSLSRVIADMQREGIISIQGRKCIKILDRERLADIMEGIC